MEAETSYNFDAFDPEGKARPVRDRVVLAADPTVANKTRGSYSDTVTSEVRPTVTVEWDERGDEDVPVPFFLFSGVFSFVIVPPLRVG